jgi:hypothetical protein
MNLLSKMKHTLGLLGWRRSARFALRLLVEPNPRHLWKEDGEFRRLHALIADRTLVDVRRAYMIYQFARHATRLPGQAAEVGVYRGGTARLIAEVLRGTDKRLHIFDTFAGMPETTPGKDFVSKGDFRDTSAEAVGAYVAPCGNVDLYQGFFPATAGPIRDLHFAFAYIDVDAYQSVLDCCEFFYPRLVPGGVLLLDDYGFITTEGAQQAVDEFCARGRIPSVYLPTGQGLILKS